MAIPHKIVPLKPEQSHNFLRKSFNPFWKVQLGGSFGSSPYKIAGP
jgi:hypothetical protein